MPPVGFELTIPAGERPQTYALDRAATETGKIAKYIVLQKNMRLQLFLLTVIRDIESNTVYAVMETLFNFINFLSKCQRGREFNLHEDKAN